jgi:ComF family protein
MAEWAAAIGAAARRVGRIGLDVLLPPTCLTCDAAVDAPGELCADCFARTAFITEPCCAACGVPFHRPGEGGDDRICPACRLAPPNWGRARAALRYDAQARRLILPLKYHDRVEIADALAPMMARAGAALLREAEVLVPVPLHRRRLLSRRYNQAGLLALAVGRLAGREVVLDAMRRVRATTSLGDLSAAERARTVAGAFAVRASRAGRIAGRRVLLIDDVLTSGATCRACVQMLRDAGAVAVDVLVAARVPDPSSAPWPLGTADPEP